jgi:hypothetical protein
VQSFFFFGWDANVFNIVKLKRMTYDLLFLVTPPRNFLQSLHRQLSAGRLPWFIEADTLPWWLGFVAVVFENSDPKHDAKAVDSSAGLRFAPCLLHTPPLKTLFVQPSLLHFLIFAPCLTHTPPLTTWFVHPSLLHRFIFAPCLTHTPPLIALLAHLSLLHRVYSTFAPCLMHTPPF